MDIIQLLEVLKPAKDVVTVQIASQKDPLTPWFDLAKAVLPAAATAFVAWRAMNRSHRQFEITSTRQAAEFDKNLAQQTKALRVQTQIATEIEIKKEECRNVRDTCAQYLSLALESNRYKNDFDLASEYILKGNTQFIEKRNVAHENYLESSRKTLSARMLLMTYLNPETSPSFFESIKNVDTSLVSSAPNFGGVVGKCLAECRMYIEKKQAEISTIATE
ncbi:hypothetical protein [Enterobacter vonholyi]|uniref:Uncharacterized protein n=1 Tax=Enterobacter vonholyi TaxID=2797505 RepID=A0ABU6E8P1_9ENTR|nr:hypothetical protein [Enterobacter vonholyi]MEB6412152.1 hypothetical protein [Enterobacter vonholyi]